MIKYLSLFSGIGAFEAALDNLGIDFDLVGYCEIDKYASKSYSAIHGVPESLNYGDITKIDAAKLPSDIDLITYGFPCQDISIAGHQKGLLNTDGSKTRSGLFFDALRIIEETKPKVAIAENVKNLTSQKFSEQFNIVLQSLEDAGYNNYWKVLNAKDYGVPQNRERVFIVSIRKDIDSGIFEFPKAQPLYKKVNDVLISGTCDRDVSLCIARRYVGFCGSQSYLRRRYFGKHFGQAVFENTTAEEQRKMWEKDPYLEEETVGYIRQLFPIECFRLFGFSDEDYRNAERAVSKNELYQQIGNSIVVNVLEHLFCQIFDSDNEIWV